MSPATSRTVQTADAAWLPLAGFALVVWAIQRLLGKVALTDLGTGRFYLLSAVVSLATYAPFLAMRPLARGDLLPAFGLACLMAVTFGVTTEAIRRGPLRAVSPVTALSPALTAVLWVTVLGERLAWPAYLGVALAPAGVALLSLGGLEGRGEEEDGDGSPCCRSASRESARSSPSWS